jgi:hypothetical protein
MKPDPTGRFPDRHWDGTTWTHWVRDKPGGTRSEDPPWLDGTRVIVGGSLATRGNPFGGGSQIGAWGEKSRLSNLILDKVGERLAAMNDQAPPSAPAQASGDGLMSQLERLAALRAADAISEDEFAKLKARLIDGDQTDLR